MKYTIQTKALQQTDCLIIGIYKGGQLTQAGSSLNKSTATELSALIKKEKLTGETDEAPRLFHISDKNISRILLLSLGQKGKMTESAFVKVIQSATTKLNESNITDATFGLMDVAIQDRGTAWKIKQCIYVAGASAYRFTELKSEKPKASLRLKHIAFHVPDKDKRQATKALTLAQAATAGMALTKDLGNRPGNILTPKRFAQAVEKLGKSHKSLKVKIFNETDIKKMKMGAFLSVARGSDEPPRMIQIEYNGSKSKKAPIVLVGKGVTFDTGGTSLKPPATMDEMKYDMCGAGSVVGTLKALAEMKAPVHVIGVIGATENMPGGRATKPGDIVTTMSGQTVEVLNTDAEGRLVLCDLLTYVKKFKPKVVLDIATLTGAMVVALGHVASGFFTRDDKLANALTSAGNDAWDRTWRLPLWDDYHEPLASNFADVANIGQRYAGSITAACYLERFAKGYTWAHLDIAGIAWLTGKDKGATARPVPLLMEYILNYA